MTYLVGTKVQKQSGKPFQNGEKTAVIKDYGIHPITNNPIYFFEEFDGFVEQRGCIEIPEWFLDKPRKRITTPESEQMLDLTDCIGFMPVVKKRKMINKEKTEMLLNRLIQDTVLIDCLGKDFTAYIKTDEDLERFLKMNSLMYQTINVPFSKCFNKVAEALNLERKLIGSGAQVIVIDENKTNQN